VREDSKESLVVNCIKGASEVDEEGMYRPIVAPFVFDGLEECEDVILGGVSADKADLLRSVHGVFRGPVVDAGGDCELKDLMEDVANGKKSVRHGISRIGRLPLVRLLIERDRQILRGELRGCASRKG
jgi:hypothetical protein